MADYRAALGDWQAELKGYVQTASARHHPGKDVIDTAITRIGKQLAIRDAFEFIEALLSAKSDWLDTSEDIHDVVSFYKTQLPTWRKLLEALTGFADNRDVLLKLPAVATALADLESIRDNPTPYGQIPRRDADQDGRGRQRNRGSAAPRTRPQLDRRQDRRGHEISRSGSGSSGSAQQGSAAFAGAEDEGRCSVQHSEDPLLSGPRRQPARRCDADHRIGQPEAATV
ncbi:MAG: hypothetical protein V5B40_06150 [Candidatus Accumulibacter meliphilus]